MKSKRLDHWLTTFGLPTDEDDLTDKRDPFAVELTIEHAIRIIQRNERGRIGIQRAVLVANWRKEALRKEKMAASGAGGAGGEENERQIMEKQALCASLIASHWKRKMVQRKFQRMRNEEFAFLGKFRCSC